MGTVKQPKLAGLPACQRGGTTLRSLLRRGANDDGNHHRGHFQDPARQLTSPASGRAILQARAGARGPRSSRLNRVAHRHGDKPPRGATTSETFMNMFGNIPGVSPGTFWLTKAFAAALCLWWCMTAASRRRPNRIRGQGSSRARPDRRALLLGFLLFILI